MLMRVWRLRCARVAACGILGGALFTAPAGAVSNVSASVSTGNSLDPSFLNRSEFHQSEVGDVSSFLDFGDLPNYGTYHVTGVAKAGFLFVGASGEFLIDEYVPSAFNGTLLSSSAKMTDNITIDGSGPGFFQFVFDVVGSGGSTSPNSVGAFLNFRATGGDNPSATGITISAMLPNLPSGTFSSPLIPITFGEPFPVLVQMVTELTRGNTPNPGPIIAGINYANTATLTAFNVFDASGQPITSFNVTSDSGTDYANLPEPASLAILCCGGLIMLRRRRA